MYFNSYMNFTIKIHLTCRNIAVCNFYLYLEECCHTDACNAYVQFPQRTYYIDIDVY